LLGVFVSRPEKKRETGLCRVCFSWDLKLVERKRRRKKASVTKGRGDATQHNTPTSIRNTDARVGGVKHHSCKQKRHDSNKPPRNTRGRER